MVLRSLRNAFVSQKIESRHFFTYALFLLMKNSLKIFIMTPPHFAPGREKLLTLPGTVFSNYPQQKGEG